MKQGIGMTHAVVLGAILAVGPVLAHDHATGVVKERMDMMETMAKSVKTIRERIRDKRDFSAIKAEALMLTEHARHMPHLFPAGSTQTPTDAGAAIWKNWADFETRVKAMETASLNLANADVGDVAKLSALARAISHSCN